MDTFVIFTILLYFFKNPSSWILEQLIFFMGDNLLSSSLKQSSFNSCKDSKSNPYSIEVISLMMTILSALSPAI